jgi:hypothetical protein
LDMIRPISVRALLSNPFHGGDNHGEERSESLREAAR